LDALEGPSDDKKSGAAMRVLDLKTQILVTIRAMLAYNKSWFSAFYPRVMTALLATRRPYEVTNHLVSGLEETAEDIVAVCNPPEVIDAVLPFLQSEDHTDAGYRTITMGIYVLTGLIHRLNQNHLHLPSADLERLGQFANSGLSRPHPDVRRAITDFCVELHEMVHNDDAFWRMINAPGGDHRNLLTYYIAKRSAAQKAR
jgi:CLIP-associating protein 1/2